MAGKKKRKTKQREMRAANLTQLAEKIHPLDHPASTRPAHHGRARHHPQTPDTATSSQAQIHPSTARPSLGDHFRALPPELRLHIFALLLVQPVKWNLAHDKTCHYRPYNDFLPTIHSNVDYTLRRELGLINLNTCIRCQTGHYHQRAPLWRRDDPPLKVWRNPWRSEWAPEVTNEFMCSDCWDSDLRPGVHPRPLELLRDGRMKCRCARRRNLQLLLVCKRWYHEAGLVFYTSNTFAFESIRIFSDFTSNLPAHWRRLISKISIRFYHPDETLVDSAPLRFTNNILATLPRPKSLKHLFPALQSLPSLSHLELDALLLTRASTIPRLLRLGLRNLRSLRFTLRNRPNWVGDTRRTHLRPLYPEFSHSRILVGGLAESVARSIMGKSRHPWLKNRAALDRATQRMAWLIRGLLWPKSVPFHPDDDDEGQIGRRKCASRLLPSGERRIWYDEDPAEWELVWRLAQGGRVVWDYAPGGAPWRRRWWLGGEGALTEDVLLGRCGEGERRDMVWLEYFDGVGKGDRGSEEVVEEAWDGGGRVVEVREVDSLPSLL